MIPIKSDFMVFVRSYQDKDNVVNEIKADMDNFLNKEFNPMAKLLDSKPDPNGFFLVKIQYISTADK